VAPRGSRPRNAKMAANSMGGKTKPPKSSASSRLSCWGITPSWEPLSNSDPTPKAKNASGSGLASGLSTMRVASSTHRCESSRLRVILLCAMAKSLETRPCNGPHSAASCCGSRLVCWPSPPGRSSLPCGMGTHEARLSSNVSAPGAGNGPKGAAALHLSMQERPLGSRRGRYPVPSAL
jgi:hypothetical protein